MTQATKFILLTVAGILAYQLTKAGKKMSSATMFRNFSNAEAIKLIALTDSLERAGFTGDRLRWAIASLLHETGRFTARSNVARLNNNYSGIKWLNRARQKNATKGSPVPPSERFGPADNPLNFYAKFNTVDDWAKDYYRIVSTFGAKPIEADTVENWVTRLKQNKYFGGSESGYLRGVKAFLRMLT